MRSKHTLACVRYLQKGAVHIIESTAESTVTGIIKRIEVRTRLAVFTNRQCETDNGRLSVNSLAVIQIIRQAGVLSSKQ